MAPRDHWSGATAYTHLGMTLAMVMLGGFFGGYWLDGKFGTLPLLAIVGTFLGAIAGFIYLINTLKQLQRKREEENSKSDE